MLAAPGKLGGGAVRRWKQGRTLRLRPGVVQPNAEIVSRILSPRRRLPRPRHQGKQRRSAASPLDQPRACLNRALMTSIFQSSDTLISMRR
jgi:hypothetical protein